MAFQVSAPCLGVCWSAMHFPLLASSPRTVVNIHDMSALLQILTYSFSFLLHAGNVYWIPVVSQAGYHDESEADPSLKENPVRKIRN